jgi:mono/diheme cytochrome c family protein
VSRAERASLLVTLVTAALLLGGAAFARVGAQPPRTPVQVASGAEAPSAVIGRYCIGCHNVRTKSGGLALDVVDLDNATDNAETLEKVVRKLRARMMPPPGAGRARPDEATYEAVVAELESRLDRAASANPDPGRTDTFHRLNRTEYQNAIRDLFALDIDAESLVPADDASHGFDNVNLGALSPTLLERYLSAAQKIARLAIGSPVRTPNARTVILPPDLTQNDQFENLPYGTRGGTAFRHTFPADGEYAFQMRLTRDRNENIEGLADPHQIELSIDGERVGLFPLAVRQARDPDAGPDPEAPADAGLVTRVLVQGGPHVVTAVFLKKPPVLSEALRQPFKADYNGRKQAAIFSVSVTGPFNPAGPGDTPSRRRIFSCHPVSAQDEAGCARTILTTTARRAYRRGPTADEIRDLTKFYDEARAGGGTFELGIEMAIRAMLVSPEFLFRVEHDPAGAASGSIYRINDVELASRLSFFLWSSIPDQPLLDLAERQKLSDPQVLEAQVGRMLADPRSETLVTSFADQWLYLRNLRAASPDPRLFPDFDDNLRRAFRRETELFVGSVKSEDRSVLDLLRADYTFVNERLAKHYGIPNVYGSHFRRVTLPADGVRGGLLGQGSFLTVTSYGTRTSPVQRGKWVLENLLGNPPPPPPGNVPPLKENAAGGKVLSMRERMVEHRANPACASCHRLMDPIGLATENFDAIGQWRRTAESGEAIDASGGLPDGSTFEGVAGLKRALLNRPELFVSALTEKLLTYALGRGIDFRDAPAVRSIVRGARTTDYRFSSIVLGVVKSTPFTMRKAL